MVDGLLPFYLRLPFGVLVARAPAPRGLAGGPGVTIGATRCSSSVFAGPRPPYCLQTRPEDWPRVAKPEAGTEACLVPGGIWDDRRIAVMPRLRYPWRVARGSGPSCQARASTTMSDHAGQRI